MDDFGLEDLGMNEEDLEYFHKKYRAEERAEQKQTNARTRELQRILTQLQQVAIDMERFLQGFKKK